MRVFVLILIALIVGTAAGSMASWFLVTEPQPLAVATPNANENTNATPVPATPLAAPARSEEQDAREAIERETDARSRSVGGSGVLGQQAQKAESLREQVEQAPPVTATAEPPTVNRPTSAASPSNRAQPAVTAPIEPNADGPNYALPVGIGLIAAFLAYIVANRLVSTDI